MSLSLRECFPWRIVFPDGLFLSHFLVKSLGFEGSLSWVFFLNILFFFLVWTIFKVFIEFVAILLLFYIFVFWPQGMWDLSFPTRDWTCIHRVEWWSLNHWTTREVPELGLIFIPTLTVWPSVSDPNFVCISVLLAYRVRSMLILTIEGSDEDQMRSVAQQGASQE